MCGRYVIYQKITEKQTTLLGKKFDANFNASPTQNLPIIRQNNGDMELSFARWGLLPRWAKDTKIKPFFNARADNLQGNKVFWSSRDRHCLVPMNGFYEWSQPDKQPYYIYSPEKSLLSVAGLWRSWSNGKESFDTFSVITTTPHPTLRDIHHRSPVIIDDQNAEQWLTSNYQESVNLLSEYQGNLVKYAVSKSVNNSRNQGASLIEGIK